MKTDIYVLAHEIKNPLCVIRGYLEMMNKNNYERYKDIIKNEINTSIEILDDYLEYNKLSINKEEMDINLLLLDIKKSMKDYLIKKGIHLNIKTLDDEVYLEADYKRLKQVFYNIIKNSIESHAKNISISYNILFNDLIITISNDGDKIDDYDICKIGNNFSNKILGNGIGTTISKKIITMHNGRMRYQNTLNKKVNVIITLPLS